MLGWWSLPWWNFDTIVVICLISFSCQWTNFFFYLSCVQPVRDHFNNDAKAKDLLKRVKVLFLIPSFPAFSWGMQCLTRCASVSLKTWPFFLLITQSYRITKWSWGEWLLTSAQSDYLTSGIVLFTFKWNVALCYILVKIATNQKFDLGITALFSVRL